MKKHYYFIAILALYHTANTMQCPDKDIENPLIKTIMLLHHKHESYDPYKLKEYLFRDDRREEKLKWEPHLINDRKGYQSIHCISHTEFSIHPLNHEKSITKKKASKSKEKPASNKTPNQKSKVIKNEKPNRKHPKKTKNKEDFLTNLKKAKKSGSLGNVEFDFA